MQHNDSEPLFGDDVYQLLRDDSLLHRTGSNNFASLLGPSEALLDGQQLQQQHSAQQDGAVILEPSVENPIMSVSHESGNLFHHDQQQQPTKLEEIPWDTLDHVELLGVGQEHGVMVVEGTSSVADSSLSQPVPSLHPWPGRHAFTIALPTDNKDKNKWCFSQDLSKLYLCPNVAVPISVSLHSWVAANITITPVFKQSCHRMEPVTRCYNCKNIQNCDPSLSDHLVQVDGEGCEYSSVGERCMVTLPLRAPAPGERSSTILVKVMCLTSCVGGPNRRPFSLVLTLRNSLTNEEIGRQVLDVKCCKCPSRDMGNDEKASGGGDLEEKKAKVCKFAKDVASGQKRKRATKVKVEPGTDPRYVNISVPVEYESRVKAFINSLVATDLVRKCQPELLPYNDDTA